MLHDPAPLLAELSVDVLTADDIDALVARPTKDAYGNDQMAGVERFLELVDRESAGEDSGDAHRPEGRTRVVDRAANLPSALPINCFTKRPTVGGRP